MPRRLSLDPASSGAAFDGLHVAYVCPASLGIHNSAITIGNLARSTG